MEGSVRVSVGRNSSSGPKKDMERGIQSSQVSEDEGDNGGLGQSFIGEEEGLNQKKAKLKSPNISYLQIMNGNVAIGSDSKKEEKTEWQKIKGGQPKMRGKERQESDITKTKMKKGDNLGMGRGKVSFHLLKKKARYSGQKLMQKLVIREGETSKQERRKKKMEVLCSSGSLAAISDDLRSEDSTSNVLEFRRQLGISWEGKKLKKDHRGAQR
ncbi:hypothetical protein L6452_38762 [Arctium lappa]|uniref:Uncharacterized protein n=1 Tax=Arctium lappa TaxID=4217 RepID=A0ACB8XRB7_ARCLA|nr:hypothetical protein L6452_38762 [Arctium lappa]